MLSKDSVARILEAGGHVRVSALGKDSLIELASIARKNNVRLEIAGSMSVDTLVDVARAGGGNVLFDISD